ncbi:competence type IV pilus minor pilin ComGD [Evansella tamaricis]
MTETCMVLFLITTILLISSPQFNGVAQTNDLDYFFEQLEKDLYEAQMTAISKGMLVSVAFFPTTNEYIVRHGTTVFVRRSLPKGLRVTKGSLDMDNIRYLTSGNLHSTGTIHFYYSGKKYTLVFQFVRGRFYFDK